MVVICLLKQVFPGNIRESTSQHQVTGNAPDIKFLLSPGKMSSGFCENIIVCYSTDTVSQYYVKPSNRKQVSQMILFTEQNQEDRKKEEKKYGDKINKEKEMESRFGRDEPQLFSC